MKDKFTIDQWERVERRDVLKGMTALGAAGLVFSVPSLVHGAESVVRGYGSTTAQLKDWTPFTKTTGLTIEWTPTSADLGIFMRDVIANAIGDNHDLLVFDGGSEDQLGPEGYFLPIDTSHPELTLWERTSNDFKRAGILTDNDGVVYGIPMSNGADTFGFWPEEMGVANPTETQSWALLFESEQAKGHCALDATMITSMPEVAQWLKVSKQATINDPTDLEPEEAKAVADYLIRKKQSGHFRTFHSSFDEQVSLLGNKEVYIQNCWEPAVHEVNQQQGKEVVYYAYAEFHLKWGDACYIASQAADRGNLDNIYRTLNYFLSGEYHALQARDRGYGGANMDLALEYATANDWPQSDIDAIEQVREKIERKYAMPALWNRLIVKNKDVMEEEWQRFLNA